MCEGHVPHSEVIENPENCQTVPNTVPSLHSDERGDPVLLVSLHYLCKEEYLILSVVMLNKLNIGIRKKLTRCYVWSDLLVGLRISVSDY